MNDLDAIYEKVYAYLAKKCKGAYFKSTPYGNLEICDNRGGHIGLISLEYGLSHDEMVVINNINEMVNNINPPIASKKAVVDAMIGACKRIDFMRYDVNILLVVDIVKHGSTLESLAIEADLA